MQTDSITSLINQEKASMKRMNHAVAALTLALGALLASATWANSQTKPPDQLMVVPNDLKWADAPSLPPGAKFTVIEGPLDKAVPFTVRILFPPNYKVPAHWHPAIEHVTVISGTINMGMGDKLDEKKTMALPVGSMAIMQPKVNHYFWTKEGAITQAHGMGPFAINYVNPADDPRKK
jgi:hypothetical protein